MREYPIEDIMDFIASTADHWAKAYRPGLADGFEEIAEVARKHRHDVVREDGETE